MEVNSSAYFCFLLRRSDAKNDALLFAEKVFNEAGDFNTLTSIFEKIIANYAQSVQEKNKSLIKSKILFSQTSLLNGENFFNEQEIEDLLCRKFEKIAVDNIFKYQELYFSLLTSVFLDLANREFYLEKVTNHFIKWLLKLDKIHHLQLFYLNGFLNDSVFMAVLFCELGSAKRITHTLKCDILDPYEPIFDEIKSTGKKDCFQIGLEYLRKVKNLLPKRQYDEIISTYMIENYKINEVIYLLQSNEVLLENIDLKKFLTNSKSKNSNYSFNNTLAFVNAFSNFKVHTLISNTELEKIIKI